MSSSEDNRDFTDESQPIDPILREQMERFIERNYRAEQVEPYPPEWLNDFERGWFCNISEKLLGEQQSDQWLQNKVFKGIGSGYLDFDRPLEPTEAVAVADIEDVQFGILARDLLNEDEGKYTEFLERVIDELSKSPKYSNDPERVNDGMMAGIAYALNDPKPGNMDQRLNFLALFPENLSFEAIDAFSSREQALSLWNRLQTALSALKISVKKDEELTEAHRAAGWRSVFTMRKKENGKTAVLDCLATIAADSSTGAGDGLISYVHRIILRGNNKSMEDFLRFHIERRTLSARTKEGERKKREVPIAQDGEDGEVNENPKVSTTEEITEDGVKVRSAATRHIDQRAETYEERRQKAETAKEIATDTFYGTVELVDELIALIHGDAVETYNALIASGKPTNDSHILGLLLPEALHYYVKAAVDQINALILPKNEASLAKAKRKGVNLAYKMGRSVISFTQTGRRDLASVVDLAGLKRYLAPYAQAKSYIYKAHIRGKTKDEIALEGNLDPNLVEDTIRQINLIRLSPVQQKKAVFAAHEKGMKPEQIAGELNLSLSVVKDALSCYQKEKQAAAAKGDNGNIGESYEQYFIAKTDAAAVKNGFSWRWGRILQPLYAPLRDDPRNDAIIEAEARKIEAKLAKKLAEPRRRQLNQLLQLYREGKRYEFLEELCRDERKVLLRRRVYRFYTAKEPGALIDLSSLLPAHSYIKDGTIPPKVYPKRVQNELRKLKDETEKQNYLAQPFLKLVNEDEYGELQPGAAWGHNVCRATGESNLRMFYDIFHGGLWRENKEHKDIRRKAAVIVQMRRVKAAKDGSGESGAESEPTDPTV